ncbi:FtsK/SpoIIIE domain-containing protein [Streptomyces sp. M10(2022)]
MITNLADDLGLVDRMRQALHGEQQRRQKMLRRAGNVDSVREYQLRRDAGGTDVDGKPLEPLPYLLIVVDEFGELLSQRPDFIELFVQIGRVGRSLGMHLLLSTQRLEEGRLRGLESHLSYRICLRTFSATESRAVIGTSDAYTLPAIPGSAYLKVDESVYERFRVAHVSAPYREHDPDSTDETTGPVPFAVHGDLPPSRRRRPSPSAGTGTPTPGPPNSRSPSSACSPRTPRPPGVAAAAARARRPHPLLGEEETDPELGLHCPSGRTRGDEVPRRRSRRPGAAGAAAARPGPGGAPRPPGPRRAPQSGKSTFLRTAMLSAMLTHTPDDLQFYAVDMGGGSLLGWPTPRTSPASPDAGTTSGCAGSWPRSGG